MGELLSLLAAREGHFAFESGHHGRLWLDLDHLFLQPGRLWPFVRELARTLARYQATAVCGPLVGGALLAHMLAGELGLEFYYTERVTAFQPGALPRAARYRLPPGLRPRLQGQAVAVVDDAINAGSAVGATLAELRAHGARPVVVGALLVLGSTAPRSFQEQGLALETLLSLPADLWLPAGCPLCAAGVPLHEPPA